MYMCVRTCVFELGVPVEQSRQQTIMTKKSDQTRRARGGNGKARSAQLLGPNSEIGRKLKQYYDDLVSDDVPDRFADLLSKLEQAEPGGTAASAETKAEG
jgi:hypothetical protein